MQLTSQSKKCLQIDDDDKREGGQETRESRVEVEYTEEHQETNGSVHPVQPVTIWILVFVVYHGTTLGIHTHRRIHRSSTHPGAGGNRSSCCCRWPVLIG